MGDHPRSRRGSTFDAETLRGQRVDRNGTIHPPDDERQVLVDHLRGELVVGALLAGRLEHPNVVRPGSGFARRSRPRATIPRRSRACSAQENSRFATRCSA